MKPTPQPKPQPAPQPMSRRELLTRGAASAALLAISGPLSGCRTIRHPSKVPPAAASDSFALAELSIAELQAAMARGEYTARSLAELYLGRIDAFDRKGPELHAVLITNPDVLQLADQLDQERRAGKLRGPLHGIPIMLKANIDTADRMPTSAGSALFATSIAPRDATVVQRLRAAGALLLGKNNMSEWANFRSSRATSGWSSAGGQGKNPYSLDRSPCGSSSGSGAAVAANLCTAAIGSETDGSIVCPASVMALVGLKPTVGLVSRAGIIPIAASQDTAGPMCRTVTDAAVILQVLAGPPGGDPSDPRDPATAAAAGKVGDYLAALDPKGLRGARIGVARKYFGYHPQTDEVVEAALTVMKQQGAEIFDPVELGDLSAVGEAELVVLLHEFKHELNAYLVGLGPKAPARSLAELIEQNRQQAGRIMPLFAQELFEKAEATGGLDAEAYRKAKETCLRAARTEGIDKAMDAHRLDAILAPTNGPAWTRDPISGDHFIGGSSMPAAVAGYPSITVPAGQVRGLPVGLSLFGRAYSEATLLRLAFSYEQASRARRPPTFAASTTIAR